MTERRPLPAGDRDALRRLYDGLAAVVVRIASSDDLATGSTSLAIFGVEHLGADVAGVTRLPRRGRLEILAATDAALTETWSAPATGTSAPETARPPEGEMLALPPRDGNPGQSLPPAAAQLGLRSALLIGLPALRSGAATLELYSRTDRAFDAVPDGLAAQVNALAGTALRDLEWRTDLQGALLSRGVIGQAQGIVMERYGLTGEQAMGYLRRHSQESQQPVRALATDIVERSEAGIRARESANPR